jgi:hypothetical protein
VRERTVFENKKNNKWVASGVGFSASPSGRDWGVVDELDRQENDSSINGRFRIPSGYPTSENANLGLWDT